MEEPLLYRIGEVKRANEEITKDVIVNMFAKVIQKIKEGHGLIGIQCIEKCDWQLVQENGVNRNGWSYSGFQCYITYSFIF